MGWCKILPFLCDNTGQPLQGQNAGLPSVEAFKHEINKLIEEQANNVDICDMREASLYLVEEKNSAEHAEVIYKSLPRFLRKNCSPSPLILSLMIQDYTKMLECNFQDRTDDAELLLLALHL